MIIWVLELTGASNLLSYGAEHLAMSFGTKFVGRTLLSVATTLPEIAIVVYAAAGGFYATAISSALGSNLLMMTLGLSIMLLIATTRLSMHPVKEIDVKPFQLDKYLLIITAVASLIMFIDGFNFIDGIIFSALFGVYLYFAYREMAEERKELKTKSLEQNNETDKKENRKISAKAIITFAIGTVGIFVGAEPFIHALEGVSLDFGISVAILAIIISPIAGEMPEKISLMILARKGAAGTSIAVANVLGSKILNNTLLFAVAVFAAMLYHGFTADIPVTNILWYQMILVTAITIISLIPMLRNKLNLKSAILLLALYIIGIGIMFFLPK
ncbi:MAG: sodium:calcium antiporter [Thaumarchaeota archaeon]|nr:sodium:calcium antiporter [Nitrososphaerota archaeon]